MSDPTCVFAERFDNPTLLKNRYRSSFINGTFAVDDTPWGKGLVFASANTNYLALENKGIPQLDKGFTELSFVCAVKFDSLPSDGNICSIFDLYATDTDRFVFGVYNASGVYTWRCYNDIDNAGTWMTGTNSNPTTGVWYVCSYTVASGGAFSMRVNGESELSTTVAGSDDFADMGAPTLITIGTSCFSSARQSQYINATIPWAILATRVYSTDEVDNIYAGKAF